MYNFNCESIENVHLGTVMGYESGVGGGFSAVSFILTERTEPQESLVEYNAANFETDYPGRYSDYKIDPVMQDKDVLKQSLVVLPTKGRYRFDVKFDYASLEVKELDFSSGIPRVQLVGYNCNKTLPLSITESTVLEEAVLGTVRGEFTGYASQLLGNETVSFGATIDTTDLNVNAVGVRFVYPHTFEQPVDMGMVKVSFSGTKVA